VIIIRSLNYIFSVKITSSDHVIESAADRNSSTRDVDAKKKRWREHKTETIKKKGASSGNLPRIPRHTMHSIWFTLSGALLEYPLIYALPANIHNHYSPAQSISVETWSEVEAASAEDNPSEYQHHTELYDNGHKAWLQEQKRKEDVQKTQWTLRWLTKTKTDPKVNTDNGMISVPDRD